MPLQLKCLASGAPLPTIMWSRRGMTFDSTNSRLQLSGNSLTIDDVMQNDTGRYFCCATSSAGTAAASIEVVVVVNQTIPVTIATTGESKPHFYTLPPSHTPHPHTLTILTHSPSSHTHHPHTKPSLSLLNTFRSSPVTTPTPTTLRPHLSPLTTLTRTPCSSSPPLTPFLPPTLTPHTFLVQATQCS